MVARIVARVHDRHQLADGMVDGGAAQLRQEGVRVGHGQANLRVERRLHRLVVQGQHVLL